MLKKAAIVVATAAAGVLAVSPLAFAGGILDISDIGVQVPVQACNNSVVEGVVGILAKGQKNDDSHDGDCKQKNSATDKRSSDDGGWDHHDDSDD